MTRKPTAAQDKRRTGQAKHADSEAAGGTSARIMAPRTTTPTTHTLAACCGGQHHLLIRRPCVVVASSSSARSSTQISTSSNSKVTLRGLRQRRFDSLAPRSTKIDPITGQEVVDLNALETRTAVDAFGTTWSYKFAQGQAGKPTVVLLHGVLSNGYSYRQCAEILNRDGGYTVVVPDWCGHGESDAPASGFGYGADDHARALASFLDAAGVTDPAVLVTQGFVLGQFALLYALQNASRVDRLIVLNTPLKPGTPLPGFLKNLAGTSGGGGAGGLLGGLTSLFGGGGGASSSSSTPAAAPQFDAPMAPFDADYYVAAGGPYVMEREASQACLKPFESQARRDAIRETLARAAPDHARLLLRLNEGFRTWKVPTVVAFGTNDNYVDWVSVLDWMIV